MKCSRSTKYLIPLFLLVLCFSLAGRALVAQEKPEPAPCRTVTSLAGEDTESTPPETRAIPYCSPTKPVDCEWATLYMEDAMVRAEESGGYLIVIARLGDGENSRKLNLNRVKAVKAFLSR